MDLIESAIFILFFAIISVPIANQYRLPLEVFLVIGSCIIGLMPWIPSFQVSPSIIFNLFLPPILFSAAYFTSWNDFKLRIRPISFLAIGLVIFTMIVVACVIKWIFPSFTWAESFLLGAIISPTDASAATSIIKKLGAPRSIITILEGESLINDATTLILFRFSLVAVISGSFSLTQAIGQFFLISIGGLCVGLSIGYLSSLLLKRINSVPAITTLTFITALSSYILAERLHVSGVISTVTAGIYFGLRFPELSSSHSRIHAKASWETLIFIINGFVFMIIGLKLPTILKNLTSHSMSELILYGTIISLVVLITRLVWVFIIAHISRIIYPRINLNDPLPPWPILFVTGWCGMRGIVSLAAALSLPVILSHDSSSYHRDLILFITFFVIVFTLVLPTFTLPVLIQYFKLDDTENKLKQEALARIRALEGILGDLHLLTQKDQDLENVFNEFKKQIERRRIVIQTQLSDSPYSTINQEYQAIKRLTFAAIISERKTLFILRKSGEINDEVFHLLMDELDLEELRAKTLRI